MCGQSEVSSQSVAQPKQRWAVKWLSERGNWIRAAQLGTFSSRRSAQRAMKRRTDGELCMSDAAKYTTYQVNF